MKLLYVAWLHIKWNTLFNLNWMWIFLDNWYKEFHFWLNEHFQSQRNILVSFHGKRSTFSNQRNVSFNNCSANELKTLSLPACIPTACVLLCIQHKALANMNALICLRTMFNLGPSRVTTEWRKGSELD